MHRQEVVIRDLSEKYENPIAELVRVACQYTSKIMLADDEHRVNAKSIMGIMAFGPTGGKNVCIETSGEDEAAAADAMVRFLLCAE